MRSPFTSGSNHYPGGKGLSFRHIINMMPPHRRYVETHLGGGSVMRHKLPAVENIGIDVDERVVDLWRRRARPDVVVMQGHAREALRSIDLDAETLVYSDPPYLAAARRSARVYRYECNDDEHSRLLDVLKGLNCMVIVSGYPSALYDNALADWHRTTYLAQTHNGFVEEVAWTNFAPGPVLHDYRWIGSTFRERERLRRRIDGLSAAMGRAGDLELNAALAKLGVHRPEAVRSAARRLS